jgi:tetratricopeptide (TPR) repeat protein
VGRTTCRAHWTVWTSQAIRDQAAADGADPARWREALAAADQALAAIGDLAASEPGRRLAVHRKKIAEDQAQAERDGKLINELASLRSSVREGPCGGYTPGPCDLDQRFTGAFKRYGLDLEATTIKDAVMRLKSRPQSFGRKVVGSLDFLLYVRHDLLSPSVKEPILLDLQRILELYRALDPDPARNQLRALLKQADLKPQLQTLRAMAHQTNFLAFGPSTALLLARLLNSAGDGKNAIAVLRTAVVRYPGDLWSNVELASLLSNTDPPQADESIRFYTAARALTPETGWDLVDVFQKQGRDHEAEALLGELARLNPGSIRHLLRLAKFLQERGKRDEAQTVVDRMIAPLRERLRHEPNNATFYRRIATLLWASNDQTGATAAYREAARYDPKYTECRRALGVLLFRQGDLSGAIAAFRDATQIGPAKASDHYALATAMAWAGDQSGEIAALREGIRIERTMQSSGDNTFVGTGDATLFDDSYVDMITSGLVAGASVVDLLDDVGYTAFGHCLAESGDLSGAIDAYVEAIRLSETGGRAAPHAYLGAARRLAGDLPGAIAAYRDAIRLAPERSIEARYGLGTTLAEAGDVPGAMAAFREAIQCDHRKQPGPFRLLRAIIMAGRSDAAIAALRRVGEQAHNDGAIGRAIEVALAQFEQLQKLGAHIPRILRLSFRGNNFAEQCLWRRYFAASAAIWSAGFAADPKLADDMQAQHRYNAACSAALAAAGKGIDKPPLDETAKARWRHQTLDWLKADLTYWAKQVEGGTLGAKNTTRETLQHWNSDRDLASIRDEKELAGLTEHERKEWQAFWDEIATLLKKVDRN